MSFAHFLSSFLNALPHLWNFFLGGGGEYYWADIFLPFFFLLLLLYFLFFLPFSFFSCFICQERIDGWGRIKICKDTAVSGEEGKSHIVDIGILSFTKTFDICFCVSFSSITKKKSDRNGSSKVWWIGKFGFPLILFLSDLIWGLHYAYSRYQMNSQWKNISFRNAADLVKV